LLVRVGIVYDRADGNFQSHVVGRRAVTIGTFAMAAASGFKFAIVAITQERVVVWIRFDVNVATVAAIATRRAAARDVLLPAKGDAAVAAVARAYVYLGFIEEFHDARYAIADAEIRERARMASLRATLKKFSQKLAGREVFVGRGQGGPCLTDAAQ
jgi:hypothetical protein